MTAALTTTMTAPLSAFLTRFSAPPPVVAVEMPPPPPPLVSLSPEELDARLEEAAQGARHEAEQRHEAQIASLAAAHEAALGAALAKARADWADGEGRRLAEAIDARLTELRTFVADRLARVLGPLLSGAVKDRAMQALLEAIDRLLADPGQPAIRITGPDDLLAVLRAARPAPGIEWTVDGRTDVTVAAGAAKIETRLAAALAEIAATGD